MEQVVKADVSDNYPERGKEIMLDNMVTVNWDREFPSQVWFNIFMKGKNNNPEVIQDDDTITLSFDIDELLHAIGKAISREKGAE